MTPPDTLRHAAAEAQLDRENPWPGLASYDESSHAFFSGREEETAELLRRILDEPVTVLFGKSGLGKTSLLKAGVFPRLREKDFLPVLLRLQLRPGSAPLTEQIRLALLEELRARTIDHDEGKPGATLWEYLHGAGQEFWTQQNHLMRPVFVIDQFEELFTLGRAVPSDVEAFREDLADLAENRIPDALARRLEQSFEKDSGLNLQAMPYKIVLSLREDFLADLEGWRQTMPSLRRSRMRLLPMSATQALSAVHNERTRHLVSEPIARTIVSFLSSGAAAPEEDRSADDTDLTVEPALLSLFCSGVNEHRKREHKAEFDLALVEGAKGTIVSDFYRSSLADQPLPVRQFIEDELITEHGYRNSYSVEDALGRGVTTSALDTLIDRHLLRYEHHLGTERVELTHDLLTGAVLSERESRRKAERIQQDRRQRGRLIGIAAVLALVAIVFAGLAFRASRAEARANAERDRSRSRELAALAGGATNKDPELAIALGLEALQRADTTEARSAVLDAAQDAWPSAILDKDRLGDVPAAIALSADGTRLAVIAGPGTITLWDVTRQPAAVWKSPVVLDGSSAIAFNPDRTQLAVARRASVDLVDTSTGQVVQHLPQHELDGRRIMFSPDGRWLAFPEDENNLRLLDYRDSGAKPVTVPSKGALGFTIVSGTRIITVGVDPLAAYALDRQPNGTWTSTPFDLGPCMAPQSVSPGNEYVSATWKAHACTFNSGDKQQVDEGTADRVTDDIVWSSGGRASAELLVPQGPFSQDVIVGRNLSGNLASRIKGAHLNNGTNEKSRLIAVDESGTKVALIDDDDRHTRVRIYSLGGDKPFLTRFEKNSVAVAPDGSWMVVERPGYDAVPSTLDVIPIERAFAPDTLLAVRARSGISAPLTALFATESSVVAVLSTSPITTLVFDAATGKQRFASIEGRAYPMGASGELLLISPAGQPLRLIKTRDGSAVTPWEQLPGATGAVRLRASPGKESVAVLRPPASGGKNVSAIVYQVRGDSLVQVGYAFGLPPRAMEAAMISLVPDDAARKMMDTLRHQEWPVTTDADPAHAKPGDRLEITPEAMSPTGQFEAEQSGQGTGLPLFTVIRHADRSIVKRFTINLTDYRFSKDDRYLAVWGEDGIQILDLTHGNIVFGLDHADIESVDFLARNTLVSLHVSDGTIVVPLEQSLTECFVRWLTPRTLTPPERSKYGLAESTAVISGCRP